MSGSTVQGAHDQTHAIQTLEQVLRHGAERQFATLEEMQGTPHVTMDCGVFTKKKEPEEKVVRKRKKARIDNGSKQVKTRETQESRTSMDTELTGLCKFCFPNLQVNPPHSISTADDLQGMLRVSMDSVFLREQESEEQVFPLAVILERRHKMTLATIVPRMGTGIRTVREESSQFHPPTRTPMRKRTSNRGAGQGKCSRSARWDSMMNVQWDPLRDRRDNTDNYIEGWNSQKSAARRKSAMMVGRELHQPDKQV